MRVNTIIILSILLSLILGIVIGMVFQSFIILIQIADIAEKIKIENFNLQINETKLVEGFAPVLEKALQQNISK
jgi:MFS superfamily sulfate permease-like transporter